ncbi:MAG: polysaccharide biosynthesis C-terminal domain-containing protein, partial [Eubacterium sp.]|nr:polysaccharide biosynthesis C-terminal domain-containing protein [Eubacterium sp.]
GIGKVYIPVINAGISLVVQAALLILLLLYTNLNDIALCIVTIIYSLMMCVLNNFFMKRSLNVATDIKKTFVLPTISAIVMGAVAYGIHYVFMLLLGHLERGEYFINLIATMVAVVAAVVVYFAVLIKSGGATEDDIKRFPKGASIARLLKKIKLL